jgi:outer membrane biosynthesis protein TonB
MKKLTVVAMLLSGAILSHGAWASSTGTTGAETQPATKATQGEAAKDAAAKAEHETWCKKHPEKCEKIEKRKAERHERREKRKAERLERQEKRKAERREHKTEKDKSDVEEGSKK